MTKKSRKKKSIDSDASPRKSVPAETLSSTRDVSLFSRFGMPLLLAVVSFFVYLPSLKSGFVYDAHIEIFEEGFISNLSNLPAVLSLKVLGMNLILGSRPGTLLYLMLNAAIWGKSAWGYHLLSNLLHAANVALLFVLLRRLIADQFKELPGKDILKIQCALAAVTLLFALHPLSAEPVASISYCSDLLVAFFTLLALLAATSFRAAPSRAALLAGGAGGLCALAAVTCKESGATTAFLLIAYWYLFRRREAIRPWLLFLGSTTVVTVAFLAARFSLAPPSPVPLPYLGGSLSHVFGIQPKLWVFMMGKLLWPTRLSADYTLENVDGLSLPVALVILFAVIFLQGWLAIKSRLGTLGVATYWLGLATVSNFLPLNRVLADRFYYLPMAGVAMQLLAVFLMLKNSRVVFGLILAVVLGSLLPLTLLTIKREAVFIDAFSLWSDTLQLSPFSATAHYNLGHALAENGQTDEAIAHYQKALEITPTYTEALCSLGNAFLKKGRLDDALAQYQQALAINPYYAENRYNLGNALLQKGRVDEAVDQFQKALEINPTFVSPHCSLGNILVQKGQIDEAIAHYQQALAIDPDFPEARISLGVALMHQGRVDEAMAQYQKALESVPNSAEAQFDLGVALAQKGRMDEAMARYQKALAINPNFAQARTRLGVALVQKGRMDEAIAQFHEVVRQNPNDPGAQINLAKAQEMVRQSAGAK